MNEIIEAFVKKIRERNNMGEEEIKKFSKEFCQIMRDFQIIDKINDLKFLKEFFGIKIEKDPTRCCRIVSRGSFFSKEHIVVLYIKENFPEKRKILALKYHIHHDKYKHESPWQGHKHGKMVKLPTYIFQHHFLILVIH